MRIGRAIPGADALLFRHTFPSRLGLIIAVRNSCGIVRKEKMTGRGVKRPPHGQNAGRVFEQREALARLRASLMNEASSPAVESTGMYLRRLYRAPAIPD
ncbi:hypothetical protein CRM79_05440 [Pantoea agglomerans]|nr:hypothetical protein CRM79_05440 [Pantoea agglomerans]